MFLKLRESRKLCFCLVNTENSATAFANVVPVAVLKIQFVCGEPTAGTCYRTHNASLRFLFYSSLPLPTMREPRQPAFRGFWPHLFRRANNAEPARRGLILLIFVARLAAGVDLLVLDLTVTVDAVLAIRTSIHRFILLSSDWIGRWALCHYNNLDLLPVQYNFSHIQTTNGWRYFAIRMIEANAETIYCFDLLGFISIHSNGPPFRFSGRSIILSLQPV